MTANRHRPSDAAARLCDQRGVRLTPLRCAVLDLVVAAGRPIGAYELLDLLREEQGKAAPPTVYRALDFLIEQGLVHRLESLNAYVGCADPAHVHAWQFLICGDCGRAVEMDDRRIKNAIDKGAADHGFVIGRQTVEIIGTCADCSAGAV
ncbi:MAG: transcriptional repressor [Pseudomonadota bacterium]